MNGTKGTNSSATDISASEAELALGAIQLRRHQIINEVAMPAWYWWGLAAGWIALGVISDLDHPWLSVAATLVFGAGHAAVASHVLSGRRRSRQLSVRHDVVGRHVPALVIGALLAMAAVTTALGFAADADGARHPATMASVVVAVAVAGGGPALMAAVRRRAEQRARAA